MRLDFDEIVPRKGTDCVKWDMPEGDGVLPLWVADMDFRSAPEIVAALRRRAEDGVFGYTLPPRDWRESLCRWLALRHGWKAEPGAILSATGVLSAVAAAIRALCLPGDKVIVQTPVYSSFFSTIRNQGCEPLESPLRRIPASGGEGDFTYEMDFDDLARKASDPRAKVFLLCNPHNPAGRAWKAEELRRCGEICRRCGVTVVSDEIHADLQMPFSRHTPYALLAEEAGNPYVACWSASKAFNLAGLKTAAAICPDAALRVRIGKSLDTGGNGYPNLFGFVAASAAWNDCAGWLDALRPYLHENYRTLLAFVRERMPRLQVAALEATYLVWVDASSYGLESRELVARLEREAKVLYSPGAIYGGPSSGAYLRINVATPRALLLDALERTAAFFAGIRPR